MQIEILGTQVEIIPPLHEYIEKKIGGLSRFVSRFEQEGELTVFIEVARTTKHHKQGEVYYAEATLEVPEKVLRAEATHEDIRVAINEVRKILKLEIKKYKDKIVLERRRS